MFLVLVLSGEAIFALPFHVARFFRPSLLAALDLSNGELGAMQSAYGFVALLSYFPGGLLADRFAARTLLAASLGATAGGGLYFATLPSHAGLFALHVYWGMTTILLFWGALIRATRDSGSEQKQGRAFGLLDGGRGLVAALTASVGLWLLSSGDVLSAENRASSLQRIILTYTAFTAALAVVCFFVLPGPGRQSTDGEATSGVRSAHSLRLHLRASLRLAREPRVLLHALIIVAAYCGYKGIDFYSTYAVDVFGWSEVQGAQLSTVSIWLRPFAALAAGLLADRLGATRLILGSFLLLVILYASAALAPGAGGLVSILWTTVLCSSVLVYAFRSLYFVLLQENQVPKAATGSAVGIVSLLGFTPDFFFPGIAGWILDASPGVQGYAQFFGLLTLIATLGALASGLLWRNQHVSGKSGA